VGKITKQNGNGFNGSKGGGRLVPKVSTLGQRLREISDRALASGVKTLSREQIQRVILETRGGSVR
jgi:hypothetical protein